MSAEPGRLTVLIDPETKSKFVRECELADVTPSQMVRKLIRDFIAQHRPEDLPPQPEDGREPG